MMDLFEKKKCYIYLRVSTTMQVDGYSLEAQEAALRKFAEGSNMEVVECYTDAGKSGKSMVGRDDFNRMLADIESDKDGVDYVLVFKLSRFGRNVRDVQNSLYLLEQHNVILHCVADGISTANNIGKLLISIMSAIAEMEAENISQQTMAGRKQKAKNGLWNGGQAPFGYALEKGKLIINEAEAEIVRKIYDMYTEEAYGVAGIVKYLNIHGYVKEARGTSTLDYFTRKLVSDILENPIYSGGITYGRRHTLPINSDHNEGRRKTIRQKDYITAEGQHDAIIDKEQFEAAQRRRTSMARTCEKREDSTHIHLLATLVRCPVCGAKMYGNTCRKKKKDGSGEYYAHYHFYGCKHRREIEGQPCNFKDNILEEKIDKPVIDVLCMLASNQILANKIAEKVGSVTDEAEVLATMGGIQRMIDKKRAAAKNAAKKLLLFDDDSAAADHILEDMKEEINNLYTSIDELTADLDREKAKLAAIRENKLTTQRIYEILERFKDLYDVMSPEDRQLLMRTLVKEVHIYKEVQPNNKLVKKIVLNIPIGYDGDTPYVTISPDAFGLDKKVIDESIVCLSRKKADD